MAGSCELASSGLSGGYPGKREGTSSARRSEGQVLQLLAWIAVRSMEEVLGK